MKNILSRLALLCAAILIAILMAEVLVREFVPVRSVGPLLSRYDPIYGSALKENLSISRKSIEFSTTFSTNSLGFRGPEPKEFPAHGILFLGDSYTMGYGVSDGEEYPALIGKELARRGIALPIVNAAVGRTGNGRWLKFLRREGARFAPRIVVFQMFGNDYDDNVRETLWKLGSDGHTLIELPPPPPEFERRLQQILEPVPFLMDSYLVGLLRQAWVDPLHAVSSQLNQATWPSGAEESTDTLTYHIIEECIDYCRKANIQMVFVALGVEGQRWIELESHLTAKSIAPLRLSSKQDKPQLFYTIDGHWNVQGHLGAASMILPELFKLK